MRWHGVLRGGGLAAIFWPDFVQFGTKSAGWGALDAEPPTKHGISNHPTWRTYAGMGTEFAGGLCGLTLLGVWIDRSYATGAKATLICASLGLVGGLYNFIRQAMRLTAETSRKSPSRPADAGSDQDAKP